MANVEKVTLKMKYEGILQVLNGKRQVTQEDVDFIKDRLEKTVNKNKSRSTTEKPENAEILEMILKALAENEKLTISEMLQLDNFKKYEYKAKDEMKTLSVSKITNVLKTETGTKENPNPNSRILRDDQNPKKLSFFLRK